MLSYGKEGNGIGIFEILKTYSSKVFRNFHYILRVNQNGYIITNNFITFREFRYNMQCFNVKIVPVNLDTLGNYIILQLINLK